MYHYPDFPDQVYVELTNACNAKCTICATPSMIRKRKIMDFELFRKIIDECGRRKARKILPFLHGETLLVPNVLDYFRYIRRASPQSHVNLTTNGSKLTEELAETFLREDLLDSVIVSFDGADRQTFENIRLGLSYDGIRKNVAHFMARRKQLGKTAPKVSVAMVTVPENAESRARFAEVWKDVDEVRFSVYFNWGGKLENDGRDSNKVNFCERIYHYITILADGRVALCCFDSEAEYTVGDVRIQTLHEIWHSAAFQEKRGWLYARDFSRMKLCAKCDYINHPAWTTPLIRIRPYLMRSAPAVTAAADRVYKKWLFWNSGT